MNIFGNRRMLAIVAALLLASFATAALLSYVRGVEQRAQSGQTLVPVVVARDDIPAGTSSEAAGGRGLLGLENVPKRLVPDGAVQDVSRLKGTVAAFTIRKGEQIVAGRFVKPAELAGVLPIPADRQAMSLDVDVPHGVGGFIEPGSRVSIVAKFKIQPAGGAAFDTAGYLIQDVPVLAVGSRVASVPGGAQESDEDAAGPIATEDRITLTLALLPADTARLALAMTDGVVFVTLLPPGQKPVNVPARTYANEFER